MYTAIQIIFPMGRKNKTFFDNFRKGLQAPFDIPPLSDQELVALRNGHLQGLRVAYGTHDVTHLFGAGV